MDQRLASFQVYCADAMLIIGVHFDVCFNFCAHYSKYSSFSHEPLMKQTKEGREKVLRFRLCARNLI